MEQLERDMAVGSIETGVLWRKPETPTQTEEPPTEPEPTTQEEPPPDEQPDEQPDE
jgi:hypothetical protein